MVVPVGASWVLSPCILSKLTISAAVFPARPPRPSGLFAPPGPRCNSLSIISAARIATPGTATFETVTVGKMWGTTSACV